MSSVNRSAADFNSNQTLGRITRPQRGLRCLRRSKPKQTFAIQGDLVLDSIFQRDLFRGQLGQYFLDLHILVRLKARSRRDQVAEYHVLFQAYQ